MVPDDHFGYDTENSTNGHKEAHEEAGVTLEQYASAKRLPIDFLRNIGLKDAQYRFNPTVRIPYPNENANKEAYFRYRISLNGGQRFDSPPRHVAPDPVPYGLHILKDAREAGYVLLVEGESDAQICWYNDIPALGIPGVQAWKKYGKEWAKYLEYIPAILVPVEADEGGEKFWTLLASTDSLRNRICRLPITTQVFNDLGKLWEYYVDAGKEQEFKTLIQGMIYLQSSSTALGKMKDDGSKTLASFGAVRLVDVDDVESDKHLVRNVATIGEPTYLYSAEGTCKSLITTALSIAIASPEVSSIFGYSVEEHGPVVIFDSEMTVNRFKQRVDEICNGLGIKVPKDLYYKNVVGISPKISFPELHGLVEHVNAIATVIDSIGFATRGDPESYNDVRNQTTEFIDPLIKRGVTPIIVDHKPHTGDHMIGSVAKGYHGRFIFRVDDLDGDDHTPGERHIRLVNKKASFTEEGHKLTLTIYFDSDSIRFEHAEGEVIEAEAKEPHSEVKVRQALEDGNKTKYAIHKYTGLQVSTLGNVIARMVRAGSVVVVGAEGREYIYGLNRPPVKKDDEQLQSSLTTPRGVKDDESKKPIDLQGFYTLVTDKPSLDLLISIVRYTASAIAIDTETSSLRVEEAKVRLLQVKVEDEQRPFLVDCESVDIRPLLDVLKDKHILAHNAAYDLAVLSSHYGYEHQGPISDTMLMAQVFYAGTNRSASLKDLLKTVLAVDMDKTEQTANWFGELTPEMLTYAAADVLYLHELYHALNEKIETKASGLRPVVELEHRMTKVVAHMKTVGMPVNEKTFAECVVESRQQAEEKLAELDELVTYELPEEFVKRNTKAKSVPEERNQKINWNSPEQVLWAFENVAGIKLERTNKEHLAKVTHPLATALREYRDALDTYKRFRETEIVNGRVHADWNQLGARTGRMSCSKPPLQGVGKDSGLRRAFVAPKGHKLVVSDLSQIEVRVLAALCGDENLREDLANGRDVYHVTAASVFGKEPEAVTDKERKLCKSLVLGRMYGLQLAGFASRVNAFTGNKYTQKQVEEKFWRPLFASYPKVQQWMTKTMADYENGKRVTYTPMGRRRLQLTSGTQALNTPIQAAAADVMKSIAVAVYERRPKDSWQIVGLVHDEILMVVPESDADKAREWLDGIMRSVGTEITNLGVAEDKQVSVKADTTVCDSWAEKD